MTDREVLEGLRQGELNCQSCEEMGSNCALSDEEKNAIRNVLAENERLKAYLSQWSAGRTGEKTLTALELLEENERLKALKGGTE